MQQFITVQHCNNYLRIDTNPFPYMITAISDVVISYIGQHGANNATLTRVLACMFARLSGIPEGELFQNEHGPENKLFNSDASSSPLTAKNVGNSIEWLIGQLICLCFLSAPNKSFER